MRCPEEIVKEAGFLSVIKGGMKLLKPLASKGLRYTKALPKNMGGLGKTLSALGKSSGGWRNALVYRPLAKSYGKRVLKGLAIPGAIAGGGYLGGKTLLG